MVRIIVHNQSEKGFPGVLYQEWKQLFEGDYTEACGQCIRASLGPGNQWKYGF